MVYPSECFAYTDRKGSSHLLRLRAVFINHNLRLLTLRLFILCFVRNQLWIILLINYKFSNMLCVQVLSFQAPHKSVTKLQTTVLMPITNKSVTLPRSLKCKHWGNFSWHKEIGNISYFLDRNYKIQIISDVTLLQQKISTQSGTLPSSFTENHDWVGRKRNPSRVAVHYIF